MTAEEKSVLSLFMIGVLIVVGKVLAGGESHHPASVYRAHVARWFCLDGCRCCSGAVS